MLELRNISLSLGDFKLDKFSLTVKEGEYFVLLGPTGTGKTVTLELIAGLYQPEEGEVYFNGARIDNLPPEKRQIGFVYQDYALFPFLTVDENIKFPLTHRRIHPKEIRQKCLETMEMLGITHLLSRYPSALSGGEKQRTALARALVCSPRILLLDEPLSALDPSTRESLQEELKRIHCITGTTTIHISHDFKEALALADRIGVMHNGVLIQHGDPVEVFKCPASEFTASFLGSCNIFRGEADGSCVKLSEYIQVFTLDQKHGRVSISIRPEDIIISQDPVSASARNSFPGVVTSIINQGPLFKIEADCGIALTSLITGKAATEMELAIGSEVWMTFKTTAVNVI